MKKYTTFQALLKPLTKNLIEEASKRYQADYYSKTFKTHEHLMTMIYAQLYDLKRLRDIEVALEGHKKLKDAVNGQVIKRSTLSDANQRRPSGCFLWIAEQIMKSMPRKQRKEIKRVIKLIDSSPIQLKGKGFDEWTQMKRTCRCQGMKLHTEYDAELGMPTCVKVSDANIDDCRIGQKWPLKEEAIYVFDKGYYDFNWWWERKEQGGYFVTRLKNNAALEVIKARAVKDEKILADDLFKFKNRYWRYGKKNKYVEVLRRVVVKREGKEKPLVLVTNIMDLTAEEVAGLYKERWEVELFFKWIKQNLRIKKFIGKSENAVKIQIAVAIIVYLLLVLFKTMYKSKKSLHQLIIWIRHHAQVKKNIYRKDKPPKYHFYMEKIIW